MCRAGHTIYRQVDESFEDRGLLAGSSVVTRPEGRYVLYVCSVLDIVRVMLTEPWEAESNPA